MDVAFQRSLEELDRFEICFPIVGILTSNLTKKMELGHSYLADLIENLNEPFKVILILE